MASRKFSNCVRAPSLLSSCSRPPVRTGMAISPDGASIRLTQIVTSHGFGVEGNQEVVAGLAQLRHADARRAADEARLVELLQRERSVSLPVQTAGDAALTRIARNAVAETPSATSYSPRSLGRVMRAAPPEPDGLNIRPSIVSGCRAKSAGSTMNRVFSTTRVNRSLASFATPGEAAAAAADASDTFDELAAPDSRPEEFDVFFRWI